MMRTFVACFRLGVAVAEVGTTPPINKIDRCPGPVQIDTAFQERGGRPPNVRASGPTARAPQDAQALIARLVEVDLARSRV